MLWSHSVQFEPDTTGTTLCLLNTDNSTRATVKLNSTNINDPPSVSTNLIALQEELDRMVMCVERERQVQVELRGLGINITESRPGFQLPLVEAV
jgi:hypothetical protein